MTPCSPFGELLSVWGASELAVLFDLPEEDCYKYCIRQRAKAPEKLVEIKYGKPKNLVSFK